MAPPLVSVVVPAYNSESFVEETVHTALAQTHRPLEVIVVNDGSTDGTGERLRRFGDRIRVVEQKNAGLPAARNSGARVANGAWLAFLDADDLWLESKLERQLALAGPETALVYSNRLNFGERGPLPEVQSEIFDYVEGDVFEPLLLKGNVITASSAMVRRDVFEALGGFYERLRAAEDWDFWLRIAERHEVRLCREPLVKYRFHGGMMSGDPHRMWEARVAVVQRTLALPRGRSLPWRVKRAAWSGIWTTNAWDAARQGRRADAMLAYARAFCWMPTRRLLRAVVRMAAGRAQWQAKAGGGG